MNFSKDSPLRILIVDDSAVVRGLWRKALSQCPKLSVVGMAENGQRALDLLPTLNPDLVLLDIEMPVMDGLTALPLLLRARPGIRVIMASSLTHQSSSATVHALALGAADYVGKPSSTSLGANAAGLASELIRKIKALKYPTRAPAPRPAPPRGAAAVFSAAAVPKIIVVGCSTGGPNALITVLKSLDFDKVRVPIVIVQHMPDYFIKLLAERVQVETKRPCHVISGSEILAPGFIGLAPGNFHVEISTDILPALRLTQNAPENFCRPAVDPLFRSAAVAFGAHVLGVVLTGMGEDGRRGCEQLRTRGGTVITQDENTSVVWGMPGAVTRAGLASLVLPLEDIGASINKICVPLGRAA